MTQELETTLDYGLINDLRNFAINLCAGDPGEIYKLMVGALALCMEVDTRTRPNDPAYRPKLLTEVQGSVGAFMQIMGVLIDDGKLTFPTLNHDYSKKTIH